MENKIKRKKEKNYSIKLLNKKKKNVKNNVKYQIKKIRKNVRKLYKKYLCKNYNLNNYKFNKFMDIFFFLFSNILKLCKSSVERNKRK